MAGFLPLPPHTEGETFEHKGQTYVVITRAEQVTPEKREGPNSQAAMYFDRMTLKEG